MGAHQLENKFKYGQRYASVGNVLYRWCEVNSLRLRRLMELSFRQNVIQNTWQMRLDFLSLIIEHG